MKRTICLLVLTLCIISLAKAQEEPLVCPCVLSSGDVLLAKRNYPLDHLRNITELWLLDPFRTGSQQQLFLNLEREDYRIREVSITSGGAYLFTLEIQGRGDTGFVPLGESEVVRMNLETGERAVVFSGMNVVNFQLSPDATRALLRFYPEDMTFVDRYDLLLREQWCVVALTTTPNECHALTFEDDTYPQAFEWVSDELIAYILNTVEAVHVLDTVTLMTERISLPEGILATEIRRLPSNKLLILHSTPDISKLLLLDLGEELFREIGEIPDNTYVITEVSPQGDYVVLAGVNPTTASLVNLDTGRVVQSYPTIYDMRWSSLQWLPTEHTLFLMGSLNFQGGIIMTVLFEPFTNTAYTILPPPDGEMIVVP